MLEPIGFNREMSLALVPAMAAREVAVSALATTYAIDAEDEEVVLRLVREHEEKTTSPRARGILVDWDRHRALFQKVAPRGAAEYVAVIRSAYLRWGETEHREPALVR